jgi:hypothetical protein
MDKIAKFHEVISSLLHEYASIKKTVMPGVKSYVLIDKDNGHYQLLSTGWHGSKYIYTIAFHFQILNDKIWIQQNNTDVLIAQELMDKGIDKSDIVLGFVPENARIHSGYAVA